jgi:hypothetical protein
MDGYTTLAAQEIVAGGKMPGTLELLFDPPWTFVRAYLFKLGFLDGFEGLAIAYMAAFYNFVKDSKARHMSPGRRS